MAHCGALFGDGSMGSRRTSRTLALQTLYQWNLQRDALVYPWEHGYEGEADSGVIDFAKILINGVIQHHDAIDDTIEKCAQHWAIDRLALIDLSILRIAIFEILYQEDIPPVVTINEAIELAKLFGDVESGRFVIGVLDSLLGVDSVARASG